MKKHWAILIDNTANKNALLRLIFDKEPSGYFTALNDKKGALFSKREIIKYIEDEDRHGTRTVTQNTGQSLKSMSSGEQKKALLAYILNTRPNFIVLDNPFDNLDREAQRQLKEKLQDASRHISFVQVISRKTDVLPFTNTYALFKNNAVTFVQHFNTPKKPAVFHGNIPKAPVAIECKGETLVHLKNVSVSYGGNPVLKNIHWRVKKGEYWELRGANGSGKTTLLSMITGENPKGYGQELYLFGQKKGTGESIWDIKEKIGYFTPSITDTFQGRHTLQNMIISGLTDSIGLYIQPTEGQLKQVKQWLLLMDMWEIKDRLFSELSAGQKCLIMCARAMVKQPPLLILDEPTAGLDEASAALVVTLINKFATETETTVVFVSHRDEPGLLPQFIYELTLTDTGSTGIIINKKESLP